MSGPRLTHLDEAGRAHMVDVGAKAETARVARARALLRGTPGVIAALMDGALPKGDALAAARIAGIMAAKKTADLIPLCHPLALTRVAIDIAAEGEDAIALLATVETTGRTGVEMEALTAVTVAALTLYDMGKALDRAMSVTDVMLVEKTGGKSGDYHAAR